LIRWQNIEQQTDINSFVTAIKMETPRNEFLWKKAKHRAAFKMHLRTYSLVIGGLWVIYFLTSGNSFLANWDNWGHRAYPWPVWPMLGWGIGLASHYMSAYGHTNEVDLAKREYEKLLKEQH
jgi:hypothetical protein